LDRALGSVGEELVQVDGSGLSRGNEVTPSLLVRALRVVCASDDADMFLAALPVAGETGTLEGRFEDSPVRGRVRAKTGWIRGASSLSGILERKDGSRCAFAILMNYDPRKNGLNGQLKELQESIVEALDRVGRDG
jgi:D-alanyl-D-alanine carboxypeptidase/D-alanyl-D-alanine-endopeptidase (penicillin-binding protein 4)